MNRRTRIALAVAGATAVAALAVGVSTLPGTHAMAFADAGTASMVGSTNTGQASSGDSYDITSSSMHIASKGITPQYTAECGTGYHVRFDYSNPMLPDPVATFSAGDITVVDFYKTSQVDPTGTQTGEEDDYRGFTFKLINQEYHSIDTTMTWTCDADIAS